MKSADQQARVVDATTVDKLCAELEFQDSLIASERKLRRDLSWLALVLIAVSGIASAIVTWRVARAAGVVTVRRVAPVCTCPCPGGSLRRDGDLLSCTCPVPP